MGRVKKQVRKKGGHTAERMEEGLRLISHGNSIRSAAKETNLAYPTLRRYAQKKKEAGNTPIRLVPNYEVNKIFSYDQELSLKKYITTCILMFYGLTTVDVRKVAFQMATLNNIKIPSCWQKKKMAGKEWLRSFRKRHVDISLRKPTSFNQANVQRFFDNLYNVLQRNEKFADGTRIFNLDETATAIVQKPHKVLAPTGKKCLGKVTSGERGVLVTTCCFISAGGFALPPAIIFPRKNYKDLMLKGAPTGSLGLATSTGWMNTEIFVDVMKHFIKCSSSSSENPSLLIFDNHESHLSIEALDLAKAAGVTILTLYPHTSARLQPLDVGIYAPFKCFYNGAVDSWLLKNPGKPITIYDVAECIGIAHNRAMTPTNISNAFKKCGIYPFDRNIFSDEDFLPSEVTNRPNPNNNGSDDSQKSEETVTAFQNQNYQNQANIGQIQSINTGESTAGPSVVRNGNCSTNLSQPQPLSSTNSVDITAGPSCIPFIPPQKCMPPLKAKPRKTIRKTRKAKKSIIATDTPEKLLIEEDRLAARRSKELKENKAIKRKVHVSDDDTDNSEDIDMVLESESDCEEIESPYPSLHSDLFDTLCDNPNIDDFVVVEFPTSKLTVYYIGKILEISRSEDYLITFLRLKSKEHEHFVFPDIIDRASVRKESIKYILPKPLQCGSTKRQQGYFMFKVSFSNLNIR